MQKMNRKKAYFLAITAFILCFALILGGAYSENEVLTYVGMGLLFGGGFLLALVCMVVMFLRARKKADEMERKEKNDTQGEGTRQNRYDAATGVFAFSIHGFRHSSVKNKILSILFLTSTLGSVFGGLICLFFKQFTAAYVLFGCFAFFIFAGITAAIIASCGKK